MVGRRRTSTVAHRDVSEMSRTRTDSLIYSDKKKETHLRCERQRREAINSGYSDLKELIPQTASAMGCKITNAAILFRACDYMAQLKSEVSVNEKELEQLNAEVSALEMIAAQYEAMATDIPSSNSSSIQARMLQVLIDGCFSTFVEQVDFSSYASITRTLLTWVEQLASHNSAFKKTATEMVTLPLTHP
ncbi:Helix-loop-helix DNA-binding domain protein [Dictyocaulus viviparus]|uniref:Helix-loop-helix DNA-binding domain protein n=1 Tax=Dictyocaulus viviparus TaxID=29172 RepID=A0A0D8XVZ6_DICVI|nr:Helix-loop-helix DNA-binding domain protein [Dictyocaulus viviparus]